MHIRVEKARLIARNTVTLLNLLGTVHVPCALDSTLGGLTKWLCVTYHPMGFHTFLHG